MQIKQCGQILYDFQNSGTRPRVPSTFWERQNFCVKTY